MHPVSTVLFLLGYGLALPIGTRFGAAFADRRRMAIWGYQFGVSLAAIGWLLRGRVILALAHVAWIAGLRIWFELKSRRLAHSAGGDSPGRRDSGA